VLPMIPFSPFQRSYNTIMY